MVAFCQPFSQLALVEVIAPPLPFVIAICQLVVILLMSF